MTPAIIGVLPEFADQALARFREAGFEPDEISATDGETKFRFLDIPEDFLFRLSTAIPVEFYSKRAFIGGNPIKDQ